MLPCYSDNRLTLIRVSSWYGEINLAISAWQLEMKLLRLQAKEAVKNGYCYHVTWKQIFCWKQEIHECSCKRLYYYEAISTPLLGPHSDITCEDGSAVFVCCEDALISCRKQFSQSCSLTLFYWIFPHFGNLLDSTNVLLLCLHKMIVLR